MNKQIQVAIIKIPHKRCNAIEVLYCIAFLAVIKKGAKTAEENKPPFYSYHTN